MESSEGRTGSSSNVAASSRAAAEGQRNPQDVEEPTSPRVEPAEALPRRPTPLAASPALPASSVSTLPIHAPIARTSSSAVPSSPSFPSPSRQSPSPAPPTTSSAPKKLVLLRRPVSPTAEPRSASPRSEKAIPSERNGESDLAEGVRTLDLKDEEEQLEEQGPLVLDQVLLAALTHPRDRFLLLRAEVEMEQFVKSAAYVLFTASHLLHRTHRLSHSATRLPLAPPHFQPALNSYQRLLIHRLADIFGITREVEAAASLWSGGGPAINPATGQPQGVVVLVKGANTRLYVCIAHSLPKQRLLSLSQADRQARQLRSRH